MFQFGSGMFEVVEVSHDFVDKHLHTHQYVTEGVWDRNLANIGGRKLIGRQADNEQVSKVEAWFCGDFLDAEAVNFSVKYEATVRKPVGLNGMSPKYGGWADLLSVNPAAEEVNLLARRVRQVMPEIKQGYDWVWDFVGCNALYAQYVVDFVTTLGKSLPDNALAFLRFNDLQGRILAVGSLGMFSACYSGVGGGFGGPGMAGFGGGFGWGFGGPGGGGGGVRFGDGFVGPGVAGGGFGGPGVDDGSVFAEPGVDGSDK